MSDSALEKYYEAVLAMQQGRFDVSIPVFSNGAAARLGRALHELARSLEKRFDELEESYEDTFLPHSELIGEHDPKPQYLQRLQELVPAN